MHEGVFRLYTCLSPYSNTRTQLVSKTRMLFGPQVLSLWKLPFLVCEVIVTSTCFLWSLRFLENSSEVVF